MKFFIILSLMLCSLKADVNDCQNYKPVNDITECFNKETFEHHACCGLRITERDMDVKLCMIMDNTNYAKNMYKEIYGQAEGLDFQCPEGEDPIKGTCEEFSGIIIDDPKKCTKLSVKQTKDRKICCGVTAKIIDEDFDKPLYMCLPLSINKKQRDETIEEMNNSLKQDAIYEIYTC